MSNFFSQQIEALPGITPVKAGHLRTELQVSTLGDMLGYYPFRYDDRTQFQDIRQLNGDMPSVQIKGKLGIPTVIGEGHAKRLSVRLHDMTGGIELVWFQGIQWVQKKLVPGQYYTAFGKPVDFKGSLNMAHPEIEIYKESDAAAKYLHPVYNLTEKLKKRYIDNKFITKAMQSLIKAGYSHLHENLPGPLVNNFNLMSRQKALLNIHFPKDLGHLSEARRRLKFEELFYNQYRLLRQNLVQKETYPGFVPQSSKLLNEFYKNHLPFQLTGAQKRVVKEIHADMVSGRQMNRLLQGDVGSGKTMVAFICSLLLIDSELQACVMAPTEILSAQHYATLSALAEPLGLKVALLTGSTKTKDRRIIHQQLESGEIQLIVGTHALLEDNVKFNRLGLCVIDEQHRFGVAQRARLWQKNEGIPPHVLVMTATPIPRTLAMTLYGDLDVSVIDELPPGRKPIQTLHISDANRQKIYGFIRKEIGLGRQVYIVYPLIEESETLDYKDLMEGFEQISAAFPTPQYQVSIVHGRMKPADKDFEMERFVKGITNIMVATTVIEVGVNVPNASVMIIESAEKFGLSQLHQLRGRVGRGAEQSYCVLVTGFKLSKESRVRLDTMVRTNDGFEIADVDLKLRGPGNLAGTRQSGVLDLKIADLAKDAEMLKHAREEARAIIEQDPQLALPDNAPILTHIESLPKEVTNWSRIS